MRTRIIVGGADVTATPADTATGTDSATATSDVVAVAADTATGSDVATTAAAVVATSADTATGTDSASASTSGGSFTAAPADTATGSDAAGAAADNSRTGTDTATGSDSASVVRGVGAISETGILTDVVAEVYLNRTNATGDGTYDVPTTGQAATMAGAFGKIMSGDFDGAATDVNPLGYDVVLFTDTATSRQHAFMRERTTAARYWGFYVWSRDAGRTELVVEAPHPKADLNTHTEAGALFNKDNAKALLIATTHRNSLATTDVDGDRVSDVANAAPPNVYTSVHATVAVAGSTVVQLHGYADATDTNFDIIVSEGQSSPSARTQAIAQDLRDVVGVRVGVYNGVVGTALGATGNEQGAQSRAAGVYWLHVEQNSTVRSSATTRGLVEDALVGMATPSGTELHEDTATGTDSATATKTAVVAPSDAATATDTAATALDVVRAAADTATATDAATAARSIGAADTATATDGAAATADVVKAAADAATGADAATQVRDTTTADAATGTDSAAVTATVDRTAADTATAADAAAAVTGLTVPTGLTVTVVSASQLDLSWNSVTGVTGYDIERDGTVIVFDNPSNSYSDTGLAAASTHTYRVRAVVVT